MREGADFVIVGSGLTGAVIARLLADAGREVLVVDRRPHLGGNVHDAVAEGGIRVHTYGPHYFRTNSEPVWRFVTRFADFYRYEAVLASFVDGRYERWPVAAEYIRRTVGEQWAPG
ncbi:MAG: FAD-dependent oxidoreductase, partial [Acidimicrobiales bacterium]